MGYSQQQEYSAGLDKITALQTHLTVNFYPPYPSIIKDTLIEEFQRHWKDGCHPEMVLYRINRKLKKHHFEFTDALYDRFDEFFLPEEEIKGSPPTADNPWAFPKVKVKRIIKSVRNVFKHEDMKYLSDEAYDIITGSMGFIAHYNRHGFCEHYNSIIKFAKTLLTGELSRDKSHADNTADRYETDPYFEKQYSREYCQGKAQSIRGIARAAKAYLRKNGIKVQTRGDTW